MSDYGRDSLDLDEDRLPWLEPADDFDDDDGISPLKLLAFILAGLVVVGAIVGGVWWVKDRQAATGGGEGKLIAAPAGDYKIPANQADAKAFAGEGDASYAASEGVEKDGKIDPSRLPETPVIGGGEASEAQKAATAARPSARVNAPVGDATKAAATKQASVAPASASGPMIQLGAYGSQASARDAWGRLSKRFDYLAPLGTSIEPTVIGGTTLYRLRAGAPSAAEANTLCGKLKVAGESCLVIK